MSSISPTIVALAHQLIAVPSVTGNRQGIDKALALIRRELAGTGVESFEHGGIPSLLFFNTPTRPESFTLVLNAHIDVVSGTAEQFRPYVEGDRLFGRGAYDMKGAAAAEIIAFRETAARVNYPLGLMIVTDEETGGFHGTKYQVERGITAKAVVVGECGTNGNIGIAAKGILWLRVTCKGSSAHGAYPWKGVNAVWRMYDFLRRLDRMFPLPEKESWTTTVNVGSIETPNKTFNAVPDICTVGLDIRYVPEQREKLVDRIMSLAPAESDSVIEVFEPSYDTDRNNPYVAHLTKAAAHVTGSNPGLIRMHGGSDLRHFAPGTSVMEFGPEGGGQHSDREWVSLSGLSTYEAILRSFLLGLPIKP